MINQKQQKEMLDYLVAKLENSYSSVVSMTRKLSHGIDTNYIKVDDGLLLLIDKGFLVKEKGQNINTLEEVYGKALNFCKVNYGNHNVGFVFYKDGENFFRTAAPKHYYKSEKGLSLKNYSDEELHRMIFFRPEEKFIYEKIGNVQYYQPCSEKLEQGIIIYDFKPVMFDYSHIDPTKKFKPRNKTSEKNHLWTNRKFIDGDIKLSNGIIMPYKI